jgi:hypothetical protein
MQDVDSFILKAKATEIYEAMLIELDDMPNVLAPLPEKDLSQGTKALCNLAQTHGYHPYHAVDSARKTLSPEIVLLGTAQGKMDFSPILEALVKDGFRLASEGFDEDIPIMAYGLSSMQNVVNKVAQKCDVPILGIDDHILLVNQQQYIRDFYRQETDRDKIHKGINAMAARESHHFASRMAHAERNEKPTVFVMDDMHLVSPFLAKRLEDLKVRYVSFVTPQYKKGKVPEYF